MIHGLFNQPCIAGFGGVKLSKRYAARFWCAFRPEFHQSENRSDSLFMPLTVSVVQYPKIFLQVVEGGLGPFDCLPIPDGHMNGKVCDQSLDLREQPTLRGLFAAISGPHFFHQLKKVFDPQYLVKPFKHVGFSKADDFRYEVDGSGVRMQGHGVPHKLYTLIPSGRLCFGLRVAYLQHLALGWFRTASFRLRLFSAIVILHRLAALFSRGAGACAVMGAGSTTAYTLEVC